MSQILIDARPQGTAPAGTVVAPTPSGIPATGDRRRPGRIENASPELIALMRKPDRAARLRVALYDAPGFVLPQATARRPRTDRHSMLRMAGAVAACTGACTAAFQAMLMVWG